MIRGFTARVGPIQPRSPGSRHQYYQGYEIQVIVEGLRLISHKAGDAPSLTLPSATLPVTCTTKLILGPSAQQPTFSILPITTIATFEMSDIRTGGIITWENAGPLTATWSAPESCATSRGLIHRGPAFPGFNTSLAYVIGKCDENGAAAECVPNGDKVDEIYEDRDREVGPMVSYYHSPASVCPQGWTSVGHAAVNNGTATSTGIFAPTVFYDGSPTSTIEFPYANWIANMFTSVLEPTETAVACCPR